uniref:Bestrophin homolog n=1 Tax=Macrostomum lignano TaxID=282301 RepID=A0A1I8HS65_9PLAT
MTYSYSFRVTTVRLFGLARLLTIWRASVYKLVFLELLIYCLLYATGSCVYRFALSQTQKKLFEKVVVYCGTLENVLPLTFVLGFYVSVVVQRWWSQFMNIPWPDRMMAYISALIPGLDEATVTLRRTLIRYLLLSEVLLLMAVSAPIRKRFPDVESLVQQGLMTNQEYELYTDEKVPHISSKYWLPTHWCAILLGRARREKKIKDNFSLTVLLNELSTYKSCLGTVFSFDWISLPLVYTQVATISVYGFFINTLLSRQYLNHTSVRAEFGPEVSAKYAIDLYVPIDTLLQLFFYLGWLKVAEQMLNPFGEDDDDFECNFIVDRNLKVGLYAVDGALRREPTLQRDVWWQSGDPRLSYTEASEKFAMADGWFGSAANIAVPSIAPTDSTASRINLLPGIPEVTPLAGAVDGDNDEEDGEDNDEDNDEEETGSRVGRRLSLLSRSLSHGREASAADFEAATSAAEAGRRLPPLLHELKKPA